MCYCHNTVDSATGDGELRKRKPGEDGKAADATSSAPAPKASSKLSGLDIGRFIVALLLLAGGLSWFITGESVVWNWRRLPTLVGQAQSFLKGPIQLTDDQLALYDGSDPTRPIYVGLNGSIYDVSASPKTYGPGGGYSFFAGRDATRAFLTGCFQEDLTPDIRGVEEMHIPVDPADETLTNAEKKIRRERDMRHAKKQIEEVIGHWAEVFSGKTGRPYFFVGRIVRQKGWLENLPKRELCAPALEGRPKREDVGPKK